MSTSSYANLAVYAAHGRFTVDGTVYLVSVSHDGSSFEIDGGDFFWNGEIDGAAWKAYPCDDVALPEGVLEAARKAVTS